MERGVPNSTLEIELVATTDEVIPPDNNSVAFDQGTLVDTGLANLVFATGLPWPLVCSRATGQAAVSGFPSPPP
jgi:hypothetical protein